MSFFKRLINDKGFAKTIFILALVGIFVAETVIVNVLHLGHGHFWFEETPGFGSWYGFISSVAIIVVAKIILPSVLSRKEDYYD